MTFFSVSVAAACGGVMEEGKAAGVGFLSAWEENRPDDAVDVAPPKILLAPAATGLVLSGFVEAANPLNPENPS